MTGVAGPQIWPPVVDPAKLTRQVWDVQTARSVPGFARALQLYGGLISQCPLDQYRGDTKLSPRPRLLNLPDPNLRARSTFTRVHVEDYLTHGNALHLIHTRASSGAASGTRWFPAHQWSVTDPRSSDDGVIDYYLNGRKVPRQDVVHVQRGAHPVTPWRGIGIVEEALHTLNRAGLQEARESKNLSDGAVPSVAIIAPKPDVDEDEAEEAKADWIDKFGPGGEPAILPDGTKVIPLSWSPADSELTEARKLTLVDIANVCNIDPYWVGGQSSSHTYKSPAPTFLELQRVSLEPVMTDLELVWSLAWFPPTGTMTRFDRLALTRDDWASEITAGAQAVGAGLISVEEWRIRQGLPVEPEYGELKAAAAAPAQPGTPQLQLVPGGDDNADATADDQVDEGTGA